MKETISLFLALIALYFQIKEDYKNAVTCLWLVVAIICLWLASVLKTL